MIVVWSKRSVGPEGEFVRDEASRARRRGTYLPVRIDAVDPPLGFGEVQALSLKGWKGNRADPRFLALVDAVRERVSGAEVAPHPAHQAPPQISRRAVVAGGAGVAAVAATGGWLLLKPGAANAKRIAVLPFANMSGDQSQAYFADGIAEELRSALSRVGMQVIGRSSDAVKEMDAKAAAAKLGVANILIGSVRLAPQMIRINAQLVSGSDGVERWAQSYDRAPGDAIKIQTDIAANVAQALGIALGQAGRAALTLGGTADSVAQDFVLPQIKQALALSPEDPNVLAEAAYDLTYFGDATEALRLADRFIALDPLNARAYDRKSRALTVLRRYPQAIEAGRTALQLAPNRYNGHIPVGDSLTLSGQHAAAKAEYQAMPADNLFRLTGEAVVAARTGDSASAKRTLSRMKQLFGALAPYQYSQINVQLGDVDGAFAELENAIEVKDAGLIYLRTDPFIHPIRNDPRYAALLRKLNFP